MPPCCAIVCLILGLAGIILFCAGFALPYWFLEPGVDGSSHGLWQTRDCQAGTCTLSGIGFGITAAFESARVFSCATILMSLLAFIFNVILVNKATKAWAVRTAVVWGCVVLFNLLVVLLFGVTERRTLEQLTLAGVNTSESVSARLEWGFWVTIASLIIFFLLTISCGVLACSSEVDDVDAAGDTISEKIRKSTPEESKFHRLQPLMYPTDSRSRDGVSFISTRTGEGYADTSRTTVTQPSIYPYSNGQVMPTSRAAANIDNKRIRLNALDAPHYMSPTKLDDYSTIGSGKFILNRPTMAPAVDSEYSSGTAITIRKQGDSQQDSVYSLNVSSGGIAVPMVHSSQMQQGTTRVPVSGGQNLLVPGNSGPPAYTTLPRDNQPSISFVSGPNQLDQTAATSNLYPNI